MKKLLSIMLVVLLILTTVPFVAFAEGVKGDANGDGKINAIDARVILQAAVGLVTIDDVAGADISGDGKVSALDARYVLMIVAGLDIDKPDEPENQIATKTDLVEFINTETAKASKGSYKLNKDCQFTKDGAINLGGSTGTLNTIIQAVDPNASLDSVVGSFIGIGTDSGTVTNGKCPDGMNENYMLKAMSLTEADVKTYKIEENQYTLQLSNCSNPQKDGKNALHRVTDDFFTHQEVADALGAVTSVIKVSRTDMQYSDILLVVKLENGRPISLELSYLFEAELNLSIGVTVKGTGKATNKLTYTDFDY